MCETPTQEISEPQILGDCENFGEKILPCISLSFMVAPRIYGSL